MRVDDELDPLEELAERTVGEQGVALHREVGRVDLQQQAAVDDAAVLGAQRVGDGAHVLVAASRSGGSPSPPRRCPATARS